MSDENIMWWLTEIKNTELVLPEFQREYTWKKDQVKTLFDSLLKGYPTGALLIWKTKDVPALKNMPDFIPEYRVNVLLDGQQRLTSLYLLIKNKIPPYYSEKDIKTDPRNLYYNLINRELQYYKPTEMDNHPEWIPVTNCFSENDNIKPMTITKQLMKLNTELDLEETFEIVDSSLKDLKNIKKIVFPVMYVSEESELKDALTVFDRVNSQGTPLTEADLALAHMCSHWSETRRVFKNKQAELNDEGYNFDLTFFIRGMNAVINCRAEYTLLYDLTDNALIEGWEKLNKCLNYIINFLRGSALIYSSSDLNTHNVLIPIIGYLARNNFTISDDNIKRKLLYWFYAALMQQRYSSQVNQNLEIDLKAIYENNSPDALIYALEEGEGVLNITSDSISGRTVGHPLYSIMNIVVRANRGVDWINNIDLSQPFGRDYAPERHHIFPWSQLIKSGYNPGTNLEHKRIVNEIANRITLTKAGNINIFDSPPEKYLLDVENRNPNTLKIFMIPQDQNLWKMENYKLFLQHRRSLIAEEIMKFMHSLLNQPLDDVEIELDKLLTFESSTLEFKSALRYHLYKKEVDKEIEKSVLKTLCAFMNTSGGTLLVGVNDNAEIIGLENDYNSGLKNRDKWELHLTNLIKDQIGSPFMNYIGVCFKEKNGHEVAIIQVNKASQPAYLKRGKEEMFFVRTGNSSTPLPASEITQWINDNFAN
jgi:hypothetical protein